MQMRNYYCPDCQRLLFKGLFANIEIKCKCGKLVRVIVYTASALILTADSESDMIESYTQSNEVNEPDREAHIAGNGKAS